MMQTQTLIGKIDADGYLRLNIPTYLPPGEVELVLVINSASPTARKYDFSDLVGTLQWQGDAIAMQRSLRDEW
ncbi:hypothetical protein [Phormidesmis priestleyi]